MCQIRVTDFEHLDRNLLAERVFSQINGTKAASTQLLDDRIFSDALHRYLFVPFRAPITKSSLWTH